jgi:peptidoglycan-associated lipoprotein
MSRADSIRAEIQRDATRDASRSGAWGVNANDSAAIARRVRFGYDRAELTRDEIAKLEAKLDVLTRHPRLRIEIAGNADERGPDEYNLALGLRRAAAAKRWLTFHGVAEDRIRIVSFGEEAPLDDGRDEAAWERNRRDDFLVIVTPPR